MKNNKLSFTTPFLKTIGPELHKSRSYFYDSKVPGLELAVTKGGVKTFNVYKWSSVENRPIRIPIGRFPDLSIEQARKLASEQVLEVLRGKNPARAKRDRRDRLTLGDATEVYIDWMQANERKERSLANYVDFNRRFLGPLFNTPLDDITTEKILALRTRVRNKDGDFTLPNEEKMRSKSIDRKVTANRVVRFLSQTFNHVIRRGLWSGRNPCDFIKPFPEPPATRRLEDQELASFIKSCEQLRGSNDRLAIDALLTCLFTGVRRRNVTSATWDQFNLESGIWNIPETKNGLPLKVFLCPFILEILRTRFAERINQFVFPSVGKSGHLEEPLRGLLRVLRIAKIERNGLTIHSLKHTFVSYAFECGLNPIVIGRIGGHKVSGITARYGHASDKAVREGYERVANHMLAVVHADSNENVIVFKKAS